MTSAGVVLFWCHEVFANSMITNGPHPSYMDPEPAAGPPKPQLTHPSTDYATALGRYWTLLMRLRTIAARWSKT